MPELPHVADLQSRLDAAIGRRVQHTRVRDEGSVKDLSARALSGRLTGHRLAASRRHGKHLGIALDHTDSHSRHLVLHFGMTGGLTVLHDHDREPDHSRVLLELDRGVRLAFTCPRRLCWARLVEDFDEYVAEQGLGPDALDPALQVEDFLTRLEGRRGNLKSALLDQGLLAGIGNEYADEILFQARLRPDRRVQDLDEQTCRRLWRVLRRVLRVAARHGGRDQELPRGWLTPRRGGGSCPRCRGRLARRRVAGRTTWLCPSCQS